MKPLYLISDKALIYMFLLQKATRLNAISRFDCKNNSQEGRQTLPRTQLGEAILGIQVLMCLMTRILSKELNGNSRY